MGVIIHSSICTWLKIIRNKNDEIQVSLDLSHLKYKILNVTF